MPVCSRKGEKLAQWPYVAIELKTFLFRLRKVPV